MRCLIGAWSLRCHGGQYITGGQVMGLSAELIDGYIRYLANRRLTIVGLKKLYPHVEKNPISWVDQFSKFNDQRTNFFEGNVTNYAKGSVNFDDF